METGWRLPRKVGPHHAMVCTDTVWRATFPLLQRSHTSASCSCTCNLDKLIPWDVFAVHSKQRDRGIKLSTNSLNTKLQPARSPGWEASMQTFKALSRPLVNCLSFLRSVTFFWRHCKVSNSYQKWHYFTSSGKQQLYQPLLPPSCSLMSNVLRSPGRG